MGGYEKETEQRERGNFVVKAKTMHKAIFFSKYLCRLLNRLNKIQLPLHTKTIHCIPIVHNAFNKGGERGKGNHKAIKNITSARNSSARLQIHLNLDK